MFDSAEILIIICSQFYYSKPGEKQILRNLKNHDLAIIVPAYNEGQGLVSFCSAVGPIADKLGCDYCIVFVDDGSTQESWVVAESLSYENSRVISLGLSRNFGKEYAILAGLNEIQADTYLVMDSDLQHPPEIIPEMWERLKVLDVDVVDGVKIDRGKETVIYRFCSALFYRALYLISKQNLKNSSDFKLFTKKYRDAIISLDDGSFFFRGACQWVGFEKATINFQVAERTEGESKFSLKALIRLMNNAILSNTKTLLRISTLFGFLFGAFATILGAIALYDKLTGRATSGFTTVILFMSVQACFMFLSLGILGEYLARIYKEVKNYPSYIIGRSGDG